MRSSTPATGPPPRVSGSRWNWKSGAGRENVPLIRDSRGQAAAAATEPDPAEALAAAAGLTILKRERMPGGQVKVILKNEETGELSQEIIEST